MSEIGLTIVGASGWPAHVSSLLCKRPGFCFWDGVQGKALLPLLSHVEAFRGFIAQLSPKPAFVPATE
jgi:hypothetical protein